MLLTAAEAGSAVKRISTRQTVPHSGTIRPSHFQTIIGSPSSPPPPFISSSSSSFSSSSFSPPPVNTFSSNDIAVFKPSATSGPKFSRQQKENTPTGGIDFSQATRTADGRLCVIKDETVETLSKDPILECKHKNVEKCHYTYITFFKPAQEETCEENFEKVCNIVFK